MSECSGDHDWRVNPFVMLPSNPPRRKLVCAECGKEDTMPEGAASALSSDDPTDWPKLTLGRLDRKDTTNGTA